MTLILDYSFARPSPAAIKAAGYSGVMRYLSVDNPQTHGKIITSTEVDALHAAGLSVGLVWEYTAGRAGEGGAAGQSDVRAAENAAMGLGYPRSLPIFYAVDYGADPNAVLPYFQGINSVAVYPVGAYGSAAVVSSVMSAFSADYGWQTSAWSNDVVLPNAHLYQRLRATVAQPVPGTDEDVVLHAFPMWDANVNPPVVAHPPASDIPPVFVEPAVNHNTGLATEKPWGAFPLPVTDWYGVNDGTLHSHSGVRSSDTRGVKQVQREVGVPADGNFGPVTEGAVRHFQATNGLLADGKAGVHTWNRMTTV